jgi:DNA-binding response OmpR family regulator
MMDLTKKEKKILLVDDEPDITILFKLALEDAGFIVDTYQDPSVALSNVLKKAASPLADYINGANLRIDDGMSYYAYSHLQQAYEF